MFSPQQLNTIDRRYFNVEAISPGYIILQSKNTFHYWYLTPNNSGVTIQHSHNGNVNYHMHARAKSLSSAINKIKSHDTYQLTHRSAEYHLGYSKEELDYQNNCNYFVF